MTLLQIWERDIKTFLQAIQQIGGEAERLLIEPPCEIQTLNKVEEQLGMRLPESLRQTAKDFTAGIEVNWWLPDDEELIVPLAEEIREVFAGRSSWNVKEIPNVENSRKGWELEVFADANNEYDRVWHNKLGLMEVGNGDFIAFDLSVPNDPPVVYLSHGDGKGHGYVLGKNFIDFMNRWTKIGCVGCEDWQLLPFIEGPKSGILPNCEHAIKWREYLGVVNV